MTFDIAIEICDQDDIYSDTNLYLNNYLRNGLSYIRIRQDVISSRIDYKNKDAAG